MKMLHIPENVRKEIQNRIPSSIFNEVVCFVFYDNHPVQSKICDITICTKHGEVKEYYKREEVSSLSLGNVNISCIRILRNSRCQLFYLLASANEVIILARKDKLRLHKRLKNVDYYDVNDSACRGQACLKIVLKDDAVPLIFDDKFESLGESAAVFNGIHVDQSLPILNELKRKLTEARYSIQCNEKMRREFIDLRKLTAFAAYQKLHPNLEDSVYYEGYNEACEQLKLKSQRPSVTICNQKVVITLTVLNKMPLLDVALCLHTKKPSIVSTTLLFQRATSSPFWKEVYEIDPNVKETVIAAVVDLTELQYNTSSRVEFNGFISYKWEDKDLVTPFDPVVISYSEFMGKDFDVLANEIDDNTILSVLATTKKLDLTLRIIHTDSAQKMTLPEMFCEWLEMEHVAGVINAVIHKKSPHHVLNGVLVIFETNNARQTSVEVHVRSDDQILPLIHYIHEAIPHRIVVTSQNHKITAIVDTLNMYNEAVPPNVSLMLDYTDCVPSMLRQTATILEYLDSCIVKMNESKDAKIQSKIGKEIDLFNGGLANFMDFRKNLLVETLKGVMCLKQ